MKEYKSIVPEVIVGLGERTEFAEKEPPFKTVIKLHILLEDWLGDDLMKCHPCYIVTDSLKAALETSHFTGFEFDKMKVTKDEYFNDNYQLDKPLPKFYWMKINGQKDKDNLYISNYDLYISSEMLEYLKKYFSIKYIDIEPERNEFDDLIDKMIAESKGQNK